MKAKKTTKKTKTKNGKNNGKQKTATLWVEYLGFDENFDAEIETLIKMRSTASGFSCMDGMRDLRFEGPEDKILEAEALLSSVKASNDELRLFEVGVE